MSTGSEASSASVEAVDTWILFNAGTICQFVNKCPFYLVGLLGYEEYPQSRSLYSRKSMMNFQSDYFLSVTVVRMSGNPALLMQFKLSSMQDFNCQQSLGFSANGFSLAANTTLFFTFSSRGDSAMFLRSPRWSPVITTMILGFTSRTQFPARVVALFQSQRTFPVPHDGSQFGVLLMVCLSWIAKTLGLCRYRQVRLLRHSIHFASGYFSLHQSPSDSVNSLKQLALLQAFLNITSSPALVKPLMVISKTQSAFLPFIQSLGPRHWSSILGFSKYRSRLNGIITVLKPLDFIQAARSQIVFSSKAEMQAFVEWHPFRLQQHTLTLLPKASTILAPSVLKGKDMYPASTMAFLLLNCVKQDREWMRSFWPLSSASSFLLQVSEQILFPIQMVFYYYCQNY